MLPIITLRTAFFVPQIHQLMINNQQIKDPGPKVHQQLLPLPSARTSTIPSAYEPLANPYASVTYVEPINQEKHVPIRACTKTTPSDSDTTIHTQMGIR